jgi:hypothetical protein
MRRRNSNAGRDVQIFFNHKFEFIINRALSVVAGNGSIPIHPNDPSHQYAFPLNQSTVRCPTLDDVPTYANTYLLLFTFEIKIEFAPVSLKTK